MIELSEALDEAFEGQFGAEVYPAHRRGEDWPLGFFSIRSRYFAWTRARRSQRYLHRIMTMNDEEQVQYYRKRLMRAERRREASL